MKSFEIAECGVEENLARELVELNLENYEV